MDLDKCRGRYGGRKTHSAVGFLIDPPNLIDGNSREHMAGHTIVEDAISVTMTGAETSRKMNDYSTRVG